MPIVSALARAAARVEPYPLASWLLGFAPVLYLALRGGGYDVVVDGQVSLTAWWLVLLGVLAGVLAFRQIGPAGRLALGALTLLAIWSLVSVLWSLSPERAGAEVGRISGYVAFLALALCAIRRQDVPRLLGGVVCACGAVAVLAALSKLVPSAFPVDQAPTFFPYLRARLNYPFGYADGTGEFLALALPLLLAWGASARTALARALAAAALPAAAVAIVMTASRGAIATALAALAVLVALAPARRKLLARSLPAALGSALSVAALLHWHAALDGGASPAGAGARQSLLAVLATVSAALIAAELKRPNWSAALSRVVPRPSSRPAPGTRSASSTWRALNTWRALSTRQLRVGAALGALALLAIAAIAGVPGHIASAWDSFRALHSHSSAGVLSRLGSVGGSHRYQYWQAAWDAAASRPLGGIGAGAFELWWAQHRQIYDFVRNAHSLYLETLAETGAVGFALLLGFIATALIAAVRAVRAAPAAARLPLAAAAAGLAAFATSAAIDWTWQLPAIPVTAILLLSALLARDPQPRPRTRRARATFLAFALAGAGAVSVPLAAATALRDSQREARAGALQSALADAATAQDVEPFAATPRLQRALLLERLGRYGAAARAVTEATAREPQNWRLWLISARIEAEAGAPQAAIASVRRAHRLNPLSSATAIGS